MIPSPLLVRLALLWLIAAVAASIWAELAQPWLVASALLGAVALGDLLVTARRARIEARRVLPASAPLYVWIDVRLHLSNHDRLRAACEVFDHHPPECAVEGLPRSLAIPAGGWAEFSYRLRPSSRGDLHFGPVELRLNSPLTLWQRRVRVGEPSLLRVYPNFAALTRHALLAVDAQPVGILKRRRRGEGLDFEQLREYSKGDTLRQIDWKTTRRIGKLI